jgi:hypothetical protein
MLQTLQLNCLLGEQQLLQLPQQHLSNHNAALYI